MKFEEIFNEAGLYKSDSFIKGFAFKIDKGGNMTSIEYRSMSDLMPIKYNFPVSKSLFDKDYSVAYTVKQLFE